VPISQRPDNWTLPRADDTAKNLKTRTVALCQIVGLSSWLKSGNRKTSESSSGPVATAIKGKGHGRVLSKLGSLSNRALLVNDFFAER